MPLLTPHETQTPRVSLRHKIQAFAPWCVSGAAMLYALWGIDFSNLISAIVSYAFLPMLLTFVLVLCDYGVMILRLRLLLPLRTSWTVPIKSILLCLGYNNILPAKAGDAIKLVFLSKRCHLPISTIAPVVIWERLMDMLALCCVGIVSAFLVGSQMSLWMPVTLVVVGSGAFIVARRYSPLFHALYQKIPYARLSATLVNLHHHGIDTVRLGWLARAFALTLLIWFFYASSAVVGMNLVAGLSLTCQQALMVFVVTSLGMALPSSPGGLGVFEGAMVLSLSWYGVGRDEALGIALFLHALYFLPVSLAAVCVTRRFS